MIFQMSCKKNAAILRIIGHTVQSFEERGFFLNNLFFIEIDQNVILKGYIHLPFKSCDTNFVFLLQVYQTLRLFPWFWAVLATFREVVGQIKKATPPNYF